MRNFIFSIVAILLFSLMPSQSVRAETVKKDDNKEHTPPFPRKYQTVTLQFTKSTIHRAPSKFGAQLTILEDAIIIIPSFSYIECVVSIQNDDTHEEWSGFITEEENSIPFDGEIGSYTICITTPDRGPLYGGFEL